MALTVFAGGCDNCTAAARRAGSCGDPETQCTIPGLAEYKAFLPEEDTTTPRMCDYARAISSADEALDNFDGKRAVEEYEKALDYAAATSAENPLFNECRPTYGILLAEIQELLFFLNNYLEFVSNLAFSGGADAIVGDITGKRGLGGMSPQQTLDFDFELGQLILNFYDANIRDQFERIVAAHDRLERLPDCEFVATNTHALAFNPRAFAEPGVPLRLLNNKSFADLADDPDALMLELRMGLRWDVAEARIVRFFIDTIRGVLYSTLGHDLTIDEEQLLQLTNWGLQVFNQGSNLLDIVECSGAVPGVTSDYFGESIDPDIEQEACDNDVANGVFDSAAECSLQGIVDSPEECRLAVREALAPLSLAQYARALGFFADNPATFTRHATRWDEYMTQVDDVLDGSFTAAANLVPGLVQRSVRYANDIAIDERLAEFSFLFEDNNEDGILNNGDIIGFQVQPGIKLKLPQSLLDDLGFDADSVDSLTSTLDVLLPQVLQQRVPNDEYVQALQDSVEILRDQFRWVDDPTLEKQIFVLSTLQPVISSSFLFGEEPIPNALAFDFGEGLRASSDPADPSPVPLRELLPYWEMVVGYTPQGEEVPVNEFIIEEELAADEVTLAAWQNTDTTPPAGIDGDAFHFKTGADAYNRFDPKGSTEEERVIPFDGLDAPLDYDCDAPEEHPDSDLFGTLIGIEQGLMYFYFQDPSFNGTLLTNLTAAGISSCPNNSGKAGASGEFEPADLYSIHRAFIALTAWLNNNLVLSDLLGVLQ